MRKEQFSIGELTVDNIIGGGVNAGFRRKIFLDPTAGSDGNDGKAITRPVKTFAAARARIVSGKSDAIILLQGASALSLSADPNIVETFTSLIGNAGPNMMGKRSRITMASDYGTPMLTLAGQGNVYSDLCISHGFSTTAVAKVGVYVSGNYSTFRRVHINSPLSTGFASDAAFRALEVKAIGNVHFDHCVIGLDTVDLTGANALVQLDCGSHTTWEDCIFIMRNTATAPYFFYVVNTPSAPGPTIAQFKRCRFIAEAQNLGNGATPIAEAFKFTGGYTAAMIFDSECTFVNVTAITAAGSYPYIWVPAGAATDKMKSVILS